MVAPDRKNTLEDEVREELERSRRDVEHEVRRGGTAALRASPLPVGSKEAEALDEMERTRQAIAEERLRGDAPRTAERTPEHREAWECSSCGKVYDEPGRCVVDGTPLRDIGPWHESMPEGKVEPEEVMTASRRHGPTLRR